ncbi:ComEA family DNA-binding protein [Pontibacter silvestris]|uniref:ComEA family DNA-binding protein n=1 Tax=Pontibacter silvestris TaxID=2305183 RepID=A0ABW4WVF3_9BACT|nr:helix-hairpin-helix domain-containing protein [Pontibacter silvestris]MCC9137283.1 helix-hairpin-helix domain-containing protein [Pontibacter silvestris]
MKKLKYWIRRNFSFSQREVDAFLVLVVIMVLLTVAPFLFNRLFSPGITNSTVSDKQLLDSLVAQLESKLPVREQPGYNEPSVTLHLFNPNQLTVEEWQAFGLPKYLAQRILNYRNKVGDFSYKAELGKIYGLPDSVFQKLYPYIQLPEDRPKKYSGSQRVAQDESSIPNPSANSNWSNNRPKEKFVLAPFNINTADTTKLKQIRGIGSKLSARIVKYRNGLGGFHSMAQLQEVYGLQPEVVDSLQKYTFVAKAYAPPQLNINAATSDQLKMHPYISSNVARAIVAYREQHGEYKRVEDVQQVKLVTAELFDKLRPYLAL